MAQALEMGVPRYTVEPQKEGCLCLYPQLIRIQLEFVCCTFYENHLMINQYPES